MLFPRIALAILSLVLLAPSRSLAGETDCTDPPSIAAATQCAADSLDAAENILTTTFEKALGGISGPDAGKEKAALVEEQNAWLSEREDACSESNPDFADGGSATTAAILGCKSRRTEARIQALESKLGAH